MNTSGPSIGGTTAAALAIDVMRTRLAGSDNGYAYSIYLCAGVLTWGLFAEHERTAERRTKRPPAPPVSGSPAEGRLRAMIENISPAIDVYVSVQGTDLASVAARVHLVAQPEHGNAVRQVGRETFRLAREFVGRHQEWHRVGIPGRHRQIRQREIDAHRGVGVEPGGVADQGLLRPTPQLRPKAPRK